MVKLSCDLCGGAIDDVRFKFLDVPELGRVQIEIYGEHPTFGDPLRGVFPKDICLMCGPKILRQVADRIEAKLAESQLVAPNATA